MLTNILLAALLLVLVASIVGLALLYRAIKRQILAFIVPAKEGEASALAQALDAFSIMLARSLTAQIKTTLMGMNSGLARAEKAIQGDLALDVAGQNPTIGGILAAFPSLGKTLRRNPQLLDLALSFLSKRGANSGSNGLSPANGEQPKFKL